MNKNEFLEQFFKLGICNFNANLEMYQDKELNVVISENDKKQPQTALIELFLDYDLKLLIIMDVSRPCYEYETPNSLASLSCFFVVNHKPIAKSTKNRNAAVNLIYKYLSINGYI